MESNFPTVKYLELFDSICREIRSNIGRVGGNQSEFGGHQGQSISNPGK